MPNLKSAKKDLRQNKVRRARNLSAKRELRTYIRKFREACAAGNVEEATAALPKTFQKLDRAAASKLIHKNTASRLKSRLAIRLHKIEAPAK